MTRDEKVLENFRWQMEHYFKMKGESDKLNTGFMFLMNDAMMLWWRRCYTHMEKGLCKIETWDELKKELKQQFMPKIVEYHARKSLKCLKHIGSTHD